MKVSTTRSPSHRPTNRLRRHALRVAIQATLIALIGGILICAVADFVVVHRISTSIDARLSNGLSLLLHESPHQLRSETSSKSQQTSSASSGDLDDAPILAWIFPRGSSLALSLNGDTPRLPRDYEFAKHSRDFTLGDRSVRLLGAANRNGRFVVGTSVASVGSVLSTLLFVQGVLAPIALLGLFVAALFIGRRAAAPIDRARLRQLEFTADASHELRTPLSVIEAEVSLALGSKRSTIEYRAALERVKVESKRLRSIVEDLLWLARLDAVPSSPPYEPVEVLTVVESCVERFALIASSRELTLRVVNEGVRGPVIVVPADWLGQLLSVLLDNACRYANSGGAIEVRISITDDRVFVMVDDSGPGFASEERDQVFQRFRRASAIPGGAGLGLAIASAVVKATNGTISLDVAPIGGARVLVSWPRYKDKPGIGVFHGRHAGLAAKRD